MLSTTAFPKKLYKHLLCFLGKVKGGEFPYQELESLSFRLWCELCRHGNDLIVSNNDSPAHTKTYKVLENITGHSNNVGFFFKLQGQNISTGTCCHLRSQQIAFLGGKPQ